MFKFLKKYFGGTDPVEEVGLIKPIDKIEPFRCHAPAASLRFSQTGAILACCYNRSFVLGNYPEDDLLSVWQGEKRQQLITALDQADFSKGCDQCGREYASGNRSSAGFSNYADLTPSANFPLMMDFELSNNCNLECVMCNGELSSSIRRNREKKPARISPYDKGFVDQLKRFIPHLKNARFAGGEPFLVPVYHDIWDAMLELNPKMSMSIQTNGTILNSRVRELLNSGQFHINVSIDSLIEKDYERIRKNGRYSRVMANIETFGKYMKKQSRALGIDFCLMPENWSELPIYVRFCNDQGYRLSVHKVLFPVPYSLNSLPKEQLDEIVKELSSVQFSGDDVNAKLNIQLYDDLVKWVSSLNGAIAEKKESHESGLRSIEDLLETPMYQNFVGKIEAYVFEQNDLSQSERESKRDLIVQKYREAILMVNDVSILMSALRAIDNLPIDMVAAEAEISDPERLSERIRATAELEV